MLCLKLIFSDHLKFNIHFNFEEGTNAFNIPNKILLFYRIFFDVLLHFSTMNELYFKYVRHFIPIRIFLAKSFKPEG